MEALQGTLDSTKEPGLNDDPLGEGSTQSTINPSGWGSGRDLPFWNSLNANVKNLHAVVSGHGTHFLWGVFYKADGK